LLSPTAVFAPFPFLRRGNALRLFAQIRNRDEKKEAKADRECKKLLDLYC
jgi:hypothetical protein